MSGPVLRAPHIDALHLDAPHIDAPHIDALGGRVRSAGPGTGPGTDRSGTA